MEISLVITATSVDCTLNNFILECENHLKEWSSDFEIIVSSNKAKVINFTARNVKFIQCGEFDDYNQVSMAGLEACEGSVVMLISPEYEAKYIDIMLKEYQDGSAFVCFKKTGNKQQRIMSSIKKALVNFVLKIVDKDLYYYGVLKDIQLLDGELVSKIRNNQAMSLRIRTIYAVDEYSAKVLTINEESEKKQVENKKKIPVELVYSIILFLCGLGTMVAGIICNWPFYVIFLTVFATLILSFIPFALFVNKQTKIEIGMIYKEDIKGAIYHVQALYFDDNQL